jgi:hypothetical protein
LDRSEYRKQLTAFIPIYVIWGVLWIGDSVIDYLGPWEPSGVLHLAILGAAMTAGLLITALRSRPTTTPNVWKGEWLQLIPITALAAALSLLIHMDVIDWNYMHLILIAGLIYMYLQIGISAGSEMLWLGLWLFALMLIMCLWYLGLTALILKFFGGLSLLAAALIVHLWNRNSQLAEDKI